jgi:hypothetical protein
MSPSDRNFVDQNRAVSFYPIYGEVVISFSSLPRDDNVCCSKHMCQSGTAGSCDGQHIISEVRRGSQCELWARLPLHHTCHTDTHNHVCEQFVDGRYIDTILPALVATTYLLNDYVSDLLFACNSNLMPVVYLVYIQLILQTHCHEVQQNPCTFQ